MSVYSKAELDEAKSALFSTLKKCEKIDINKLGKSQQTLLNRRIRALRLAIELIAAEEQKLADTEVRV